MKETVQTDREQPKDRKNDYKAPQITIPTEWQWKGSILIIEISLCALLPTKKLFEVYILNPNYQNDSFP